MIEFNPITISPYITFVIIIAIIVALWRFIKQIL